MPRSAHSTAAKNDHGPSEDSPFLTVEEAAQFMKSTPSTLYLYLCNSGSSGGERRKRFPENLYVRFGRKVLFIRQKLVEWLMNGAEFEE